MRPSANPAGNPRESSVEPVRADNISPRPSVPPVPEELGSLGEEIWLQVWEAGGDAYHPPTDRFVVARYCAISERRSELMEILERDGYLVTGSQGQDVLHPAARALESSEKELRALESQLGLNPEARIRLGIEAIEHKSKLDAFLEGEGL